MLGILLALLMTSSGTLAQEGQSQGKKLRGPKRSFSQFGFAFTMSQEKVDARNGANEDTLIMHFQGLRARYGYHIPFRRSSWRHSYTLDGTFGVVKGKGNTAAIADEVSGQPWTSFGFTPAVYKATSPASEVGLGFVGEYRFIKWQLDEGSGLDLEKDNSTSVGLLGVYVIRLSSRSTVQVAAIYHHMWEATAWSLGYEYRP